MPGAGIAGRSTTREPRTVIVLRSGQRRDEFNGSRGFDLYLAEDSNNCQGYPTSKYKHFLPSSKDKNKNTAMQAFRFCLTRWSHERNEAKGFEYEGTPFRTAAPESKNL
jgi:hypothetical protein